MKNFVFKLLRRAGGSTDREDQLRRELARVSFENQQLREQARRAEEESSSREKCLTLAIVEKAAAIEQAGKIQTEFVRLRRAATEAEAHAKEAERRFKEQLELNATLLDAGFQTEVQAQRHSVAVDSMRIQVLTQLHLRDLPMKRTLLSALMEAFSLNTAKHLVVRLVANGCFSSGSDQLDSGLPPLPPPVTQRDLDTYGSLIENGQNPCHACADESENPRIQALRRPSWRDS